MAQRTTKQKPPKREKVEESKASSKTVAPKKTLTEHIDKLLDEIDEALAESGIDTEQEASDFVKGYQQQGGE